MHQALGVGGQGPGSTQFDDEHLSQVVSVDRSIRRSSAPNPVSEGLYYGVLRNIHNAAGEIGNSIDVYNPAPTTRFNDYPDVMDAFDIWLLRVSLARSSGTGTLDAGVLRLIPIASAQGWGRTNAGVGILSTQSQPLVRWTGLDTAGADDWGIVGDGSFMADPNIRIPRGGWVMELATTAGTAAATFIATLMLGVYPAGFGQDVVVT